MASVEPIGLAELPAAILTVLTVGSMLGAAMTTTITYRNKLAKEVEAPLVRRLDALEERIEACCGHLVNAIAIAAKHSDSELNRELQSALAALNKRP